MSFLRPGVIKQHKPKTIQWALICAIAASTHCTLVLLHSLIAHLCYSIHSLHTCATPSIHCILVLLHSLIAHLCYSIHLLYTCASPSTHCTLVLLHPLIEHLFVLFLHPFISHLCYSIHSLNTHMLLHSLSSAMEKRFEARHIIHFDSVDCSKQLSPQSHGKPFFRASEGRNYTAILNVASNLTNDSVPSNVWSHSKCRSLLVWWPSKFTLTWGPFGIWGFSELWGIAVLKSIFCCSGSVGQMFLWAHLFDTQVSLPHNTISQRPLIW